MQRLYGLHIGYQGYKTMSKVTVGRVDKINLDENTIRVRIDRNTPLGNPIVVKGDVTRKEAIAAYKGYFDHNMKRKGSKVYQKVQSIKKKSLTVGSMLS